MTDDEKANDIYDICLEKKSIYCNRKMGEETCNKCKTYQMYKLGLAEGRKELEKENRLNEEIIIGEQQEINRLEKEITELKKKLNAWECGSPIRELEIEVSELKKHCKAVDEVNEKMKCCENCKHSYTDSENNVFCYLPFSQEDCKSCKIYNHKETENDYWELAE